LSREDVDSVAGGMNRDRDEPGLPPRWSLLLWLTEGGVLLLAAALTDGGAFIAIVAVSVVVAAVVYAWARGR
jgi:hypothetical protein